MWKNPKKQGEKSLLDKKTKKKVLQISLLVIFYSVKSSQAEFCIILPHGGYF